MPIERGMENLQQLESPRVVCRIGGRFVAAFHVYNSAGLLCVVNPPSPRTATRLVATRLRGFLLLVRWLPVPAQNAFHHDPQFGANRFLGSPMRLHPDTFSKASRGGALHTLRAQIAELK